MRETCEILMPIVPADKLTAAIRKDIRTEGKKALGYAVRDYWNLSMDDVVVRGTRFTFLKADDPEFVRRFAAAELHIFDLSLACLIHYDVESVTDSPPGQ